MFRRLLDSHSHTPGSSRNGVHRLFKRIGIQIGHLGFGDFPEVFFGDLPNLVLVGFATPLLNFCLFHDKCRGRRLFEDKGEGAVLINGDFCRNDLSHTTLRFLIEFGTEGTDVDTSLAEDRTQWWGGICLATPCLYFNDLGDLFCHRSSGQSKGDFSLEQEKIDLQERINKIPDYFLKSFPDVEFDEELVDTHKDETFFTQGGINEGEDMKLRLRFCAGFVEEVFYFF